MRDSAPARVRMGDDSPRRCRFFQHPPRSRVARALAGMIPGHSRRTSMGLTVRTVLAAVTTLCMAAAFAGAADDAQPAGAKAGGKKKIVFLVGGPSHGFGAHDHRAG